MKLIRLFSLAAVVATLVFSTTSCDNDIDVIGTWKEIPIVYGVLSPLPYYGPHYLRIEKAFLDPTTDAFQIAQRADSLYYGPDDLMVILWERFVNTPYVALDTFERVDATAEGFPPRQTGIFASSPNIIYKSDALVHFNATDRYYKLEIRNLKTGDVYESFAKGINPGNEDITDSTYLNFRVLTPSLSKPVRWSHIDQASNDWVYDQVKFNWSQPGNAAMYDLSVIFRYAEFEVDVNQTNQPEIPGTRVYKELVWTPIKNSFVSGVVDIQVVGQDSFNRFTRIDGSSVVKELNGESFYRYLARELSDVTNTNIRRCATRMDVRVDAAGPELSEYLQARNSNQNLIGGLYPSDPFTNIDRGFGVFSFRTFTKKYNYVFDDEVFDYFRNGPITDKLGFRGFGCN